MISGSNTKRLFIDLEICAKCRECRVCCDYFFHPQNNGIASLREYAAFATICRHCEEAPCVNSCYHNALGRASDGHLKRYKMRCTSCKSCSVACPFGIIFQDFIPYLDSRCDFCISDVVAGLVPAHVSEGRPQGPPLPKCIATCPEKAIDLKEISEDPANNVYLVGNSLAVHTLRWSREDTQLPMKKA